MRVMTNESTRGTGPRWRHVVFGLSILMISPLLEACAPAPRQVEVPEPRRLILRTGERLNVSQERMQAINDWVLPQIDSIAEDPSFMLVTEPIREASLPWEGLEVSGPDSATIKLEARGDQARIPYQIYAHMYLMKELKRIESR